MGIPITAWILQGLPEAIAIMALMHTSSGLGFRWRSILLSGFLCGVIFYLVRLLPVSFGVHTLINLLVTIMILKIFTSCDLTKAIKSGLIAMLAIVISETVFLPFLITAFELDINLVLEKTSLRVLLSWPTIIFVFGLAALFNYLSSRKKGVHFTR